MMTSSVQTAKQRPHNQEFSTLNPRQRKPLRRQSSRMLHPQQSLMQRTRHPLPNGGARFPVQSPRNPLQLPLVMCVGKGLLTATSAREDARRKTLSVQCNRFRSVSYSICGGCWKNGIDQNLFVMPKVTKVEKPVKTEKANKNKNKTSNPAPAPDAANNPQVKKP